MWILTADRGSFNRKERKEHRGEGLGWVPANERESTRMEPGVELPQFGDGGSDSRPFA